MANGQGFENDEGRRRRFGRLLSDAMKARGMRQEDIAGMLGATQSSVSGWINGKYEPAAATVFTLERCLSLDPGTLSRPLGYLPVEPVARGISVEGAIAQSPHLNDEEREALASMYRVLVSRRTVSANGDRPKSPVQAVTRPRSVAAGQ
jgi:transcriptional regulator with XRE-family HTH domain